MAPIENPTEEPLSAPVEPAERAPFELSGGALCLDFVNSWGDRGRPEADDLRQFDDLLRFAGQTGLLEEPRRRELAELAGADPAATAAAFATALGLRESLYTIFSARARGRALPARELEPLNTLLKEALSHLQLEVRPGSLRESGESADSAGAGEPDGAAAVGFDWTFVPTRSLTSPLWPIARSAADLLVSPELARVTECDGSRCTWLFLDQSRAGNRRWCSMQSCGNRAKARRHYRRSKG